MMGFRHGHYCPKQLNHSSRGIENLWAYSIDFQQFLEMIRCHDLCLGPVVFEHIIIIVVLRLRLCWRVIYRRWFYIFGHVIV
uniref:Uncharacterized protein n=1 Tax=Romanomermis culicivorax TaxID=13658 RepID=A0A915HS43_ROMCU